MNNLPFSIYDTFAYLASGFLVAMATDFAFGIGLRDQGDIAMVDAAFWILAIYIGGHLIAHLSSLVFETGIVRKWLRSPEEHLIADTPSTLWRAKIFRMHCRQFPSTLRERIKARASSHNIAPEGRAFFLHCHALAQQQSATRERLTIFIILYGFCRNTSFALFVASILLIVGAFFHSEAQQWWLPESSRVSWAAAALIGGVGMFVRYLKFFHHYTSEVFTVYASENPHTNKNIES